MIEVDTLYINKRTLNSGHVFFDDIRKAKEFKDALSQMHIGYHETIIKSDNKLYFGFKFFRCKRRFFELCVQFKEVLT